METMYVISIVLTIIFMMWIGIDYISESECNLGYVLRTVAIILTITIIFFMATGYFHFGYIAGQRDMLKGKQKVYPVVKELNGIPTDTIYVKIK